MKRLLAPITAIAIASATCGLFVGAFHAGIAYAQPGSGSAVVDAGGSQEAGSGSALASAGSGSAVTAATGSGSGSAVAIPTFPADPIANAGETFDDLKAAKRLGWGIFALAVLLVACRLLSKLGGVFKPLGQGKVALAIGAIGALALTACNALANGGTWMAALMAGVVAAAAAWDSAAKQPPSNSPSS